MNKGTPFAWGSLAWKVFCGLRPCNVQVIVQNLLLVLNLIKNPFFKQRAHSEWYAYRKCWGHHKSSYGEFWRHSHGIGAVHTGNCDGVLRGVPRNCSRLPRNDLSISSACISLLLFQNLTSEGTNTVHRIRVYLRIRDLARRHPLSIWTCKPSLIWDSSVPLKGHVSKATNVIQIMMVSPTF